VGRRKREFVRDDKSVRHVVVVRVLAGERIYEAERWGRSLPTDIPALNSHVQLPVELRTVAGKNGTRSVLAWGNDRDGAESF
jgi:hypothetical protein